jgi:hypothetical protein
MLVWCDSRWPIRLPIHVAPVGDTEDENPLQPIVHLVQNPVVADANAPPVALSGELGCAGGSRIGLQGEKCLANANPNFVGKAAAVAICALGRGELTSRMLKNQF